jgi:flavodoxin
MHKNRTIFYFERVNNMANRIYYFTGTGNSMRAARVIAERLGNTEIVSMRADPGEYSASYCAQL